MAFDLWLWMIKGLGGVVCGLRDLSQSELKATKHHRDVLVQWRDLLTKVLERIERDLPHDESK